MKLLLLLLLLPQVYATNCVSTPVRLDHSCGTGTTACNALQSSTYVDGGGYLQASYSQGGSLSAAAALDGSPYTMSHTAVGGTDPNPWWRLDLGVQRGIQTVKLFNVISCCRDTLVGAYIWVGDNDTYNGAGNQVCYTVLPQGGNDGDLGFACIATGRYFFVQQNNTVTGCLASTCDLRNSLPLVVLREVQVWGTLTPDTAFCCGAGTYQVMTPTLRKLERSCGAGVNSWCSVNQSSTHNGLSASKVLDDNLNTYDHTGTVGDLNPWLRIDFGVARDVQVGTIWPRQDYGGWRSYLLKIWVGDSDTYNGAGNVNCFIGPGSKVSVILFNCVARGRYFFLHQPNAYNGETVPLLNIAEVDVWGFASCQNCAVGTYGTGTGFSLASECPLCGAGLYSAKEGATACLKCAAGTYGTGIGSPSAGSCLLCDLGKYSPTTGATACLNCTAGTYSGNTGAATCVPCNAGLYSTASAATAVATCQNCVAGSYFGGTGATRCNGCGVGQFSSAQGATACVTCGGGTYGTGIGFPSASNCTACVSGYFSSALGAVACTQCGLGTYSTASAATAVATCQSCGTCSPNAAQNTFCSVGSSADTVSCTCSGGYYGNGFNCSACVANSWCVGQVASHGGSLSKLAIRLQLRHCGRKQVTS